MRCRWARPYRRRLRMRRRVRVPRRRRRQRRVAAVTAEAVLGGAPHATHAPWGGPTDPGRHAAAAAHAGAGADVGTGTSDGAGGGPEFASASITTTAILSGTVASIASSTAPP